MSKDQMVQNVNLVLKRWVDSVTLNKARVTALHYATKLSSKLFVYLVEECGADVTIRDPHGMSVMHKAAFDDNSYLITYLRDKSGFDVMWSSLKIAWNENTVQHLKDVDVIVEPDLKDFTYYDLKHLDTLVQRGEMAMRGKINEILIGLGEKNSALKRASAA